MNRLTILFRSTLLIGAAASLITLGGCGRNDNKSPENTGTTGDNNTGTYNNDKNADNTSGNTGTTGATGTTGGTSTGDLKNPDRTAGRDNVGSGVTGSGGQSADRDQTGSTARRGGNTGIGTGTEMSSGDNATPITGEQSQFEHRIRQSLQKDNSFGTDAKNIKITVINGTVTLRGPVTTQQMKDKIESRVKSMPGVKDVDNQLQVTNSGQ